MSDPISPKRLEELIEFTAGHSVEANTVLVELQSLRTRVETLEAALKEIAHDDEHYPSTYDDLLSIARRALEGAK